MTSKIKLALIFSFFLLFIPQFSHSKKSETTHAKKWAKRAGIREIDSSDLKILKTLSLVSEGFLFQNATQFGPKEQPIPAGGNHTYEWDSIRTSEEMLETCEGGYCGTYALSTAAILQASGISSDDIRVVAAVNNIDYLQICPGEKGSTRTKTPKTSASGHVYVQVKTSNGWVLINTTHNPLYQPLDTESSAIQTFQSLLKDCKRRFKVDRWPNPSTQPDRRFFRCLSQAETQGRKRLTLEDFEIIPFLSPKEVEKKLSSEPVSVPVDQYPSLANWMNSQSIPPRQIIFQSWKVEDYPKHTFHDRFNLVASGKVQISKCRWNSSQVRSLLPRRPTKSRPQSHPEATRGN